MGQNLAGVPVPVPHPGDRIVAASPAREAVLPKCNLFSPPSAPHGEASVPFPAPSRLASESSPATAREMALREKEAKIQELERLAQEAEMRAEAMQKERELKEWEERLERREREAQKRLEEAERVLRGEVRSVPVMSDTKAALGKPQVLSI